MKRITLFLSASLIGQFLQAQTQWNPSGSNIYFNTGGYVGIGTANPNAPLHVAGQILGDVSNNVAFATKSSLGVVIEQGNIGNDFVNGNNYLSIFAHDIQFDGTNWIRRNQYSNTWATVMNSQYFDVQFAPANGSQPANSIVTPQTFLRILPTTGNVLIGKTSQTNSAYMLDVSGNARMNEVVVNATGADFVFNPGYRLASLPEVEKYIQANHHLPGIAPAEQMHTQGLDIGENQTRLLQKIEELTLYVIEQNKQIKELADKVKELEAKK